MEETRWQTRNVKSQGGQASILIAIIFQVLFIFFAMVINVGLLVHDKINLQNSVDVAAYYGAMKQAEILNVMAHVNYEIHSIYKLFNYRLWALSNAGRSGWLEGQQNLSDVRATWTGDYQQAPVVCLANPFWYEWGSTKNENLCRKTSLSIPPLPVNPLAPIQSAFYGLFAIFQQQSIQNHSIFQSDFGNSGQADYAMALKILASYKISVARKRQAMQNLQQLLVGGAQQGVSGSDFRDVSGQSVKATVAKIIQNNLTSANLKGLTEIDFGNSLYQQPFLVPIEVRTFVEYEDLNSGGNSNGAPATANVYEVETPPSEGGVPASMIATGAAFFKPDYYGKFPRPSAAAFLAEGTNSLDNINSLVGFEKDPWTLAYVKVRAQTSPKMLFSPFTSGDNRTVTLTAEAYAMPFGGRIGPWYFDGWPAGQPSSMSANPIDKLLPPRYDLSFDMQNNYKPPNFSRFPGDLLGMRSAMAQNALLNLIRGSNNADWPHSQNNQYALIDNPNYVNLDPVVPDIIKGDNSPVREAELAAIVPNLFEAVYFSVDSNFYADYGDPSTGVYGGPTLFTQTCNGMCNDLGTTQPPQPPSSVATQIANGLTTGAAIEWWLLKDPNLLNTGWTQEGTDLFSQSPTKVGQAKRLGGRTGYSVKIVSKEFLNNGTLPFGGSAGNGPLKNPPAAVFGD